MVLGTVAVVATVATGGAAAVGIGARTAAAGATAAGAAGATAAATGATAAAVAGGVGTAGLGGALGSAVASGASALVAAGPIGWVALGHSQQDLSWDCWKPVVHDTTIEPSHGRYLRDIVTDKNVKETQMDEKGNLIIQNVFDESFRIDFYELEGKLVAHATRF